MEHRGVDMGFIDEYYAARNAQATRRLGRQEARSAAIHADQLAYANDLAEQRLAELVAARTGRPPTRVSRPATAAPGRDVVGSALIALFMVAFVIMIIVRSAS
jgi:hypothetical protein